MVGHARETQGRRRLVHRTTSNIVAIDSCHPRATDEAGPKLYIRVGHEKTSTGRSTPLGSGWWA